MVDPAVGRGGAGARPPQRAGRLGARRPRRRAGGSRCGSARSTTASASATSSPSSPASARSRSRDELTEFALADNARAWWIPSNWPRKDRSEMLYSSGPGEPARQRADAAHDGDARTAARSWSSTRRTWWTTPRMFLRGPRMESRTLHAALAPMADGIKVRGTHAVRDALANHPAGRPRHRPGARRCSASSSIRRTRSPAPTGSTR